MWRSLASALGQDIGPPRLDSDHRITGCGRSTNSWQMSCLSNLYDQTPIKGPVRKRGPRNVDSGTPIFLEMFISSINFPAVLVRFGSRFSSGCARCQLGVKKKGLFFAFSRRKEGKFSFAKKCVFSCFPFFLGYPKKNGKNFKICRSSQNPPLFWTPPGGVQNRYF